MFWGVPERHIPGGTSRCSWRCPGWGNPLAVPTALPGASAPRGTSGWAGQGTVTPCPVLPWERWISVAVTRRWSLAQAGNAQGMSLERVWDQLCHPTAPPSPESGLATPEWTTPGSRSRSRAHTSLGRVLEAPGAAGNLNESLGAAVSSGARVGHGRNSPTRVPHPAAVGFGDGDLQV